MKRTYLDYAASTPLDKKVRLAMQKAEKLAWGNASSLHLEGIAAREILEKSRSEIASIFKLSIKRNIFYERRYRIGKYCRFGGC